MPPEAADPLVPVVDEAVLPARLRRPLDLVRLIAALLAATAVMLVAFFATGTTAGLEEDLSEATNRLPDIVVLLLNIVGGIGLLTLPVAAAVDLLARGRGRQLLEALVALFAAVAVLMVGSIIVGEFGSNQVRVALAGSLSDSATAFLPLYGGLLAFVTVASLMARDRWNVVASVVVAALFVVSLLSGGTSVAGIAISALIGWAVGLATRYALGTPTTRPRGASVAQVLVDFALPVTQLVATGETVVGRHYRADLADGSGLDVVVLDRDLEGAGFARALWRGLRLRPVLGGPTFNMRHALETRSLLSYACLAAAVPSPRLIAASEIGPDAALLAYERLDASPLADQPEQITDADLDRVFEVLATLQRHHLAHRSLSPRTVLRATDGQIVVTEVGDGAIASGDLLARIDIADMMCTLAALVGPERTVAAGVRVLGAEHLGRALPVLQPVALGHEVRNLVKKDKNLLVGLRDALVELRPEGPIEQIQIERVKPRTLITIILGTVAGYLLLSQLAEVDLVGLFRDANWAWLAVGVVFALATYPGSAWAIKGFVPERIRLLPTVAAQVAADFATLVTPPTLGTVAINLRFLQRNGVHPALATASLGVGQIAAFIVHIMFLLVFGVAAGTNADFAISPPDGAILFLVALLAAVVAIALLPPVRTRLWGRLAPTLRQVWPRMVTIMQQPLKLVEGVGGAALVNIGYIGTLAACVYALGGDANIAGIGFVYLTGAVIGQAAPTPGGLGAVEAAMAAGLTAIGLDSGLAVSAVLIYRVITFWLPTVPGWFCLNWLTRKGLL